MESPSSWTKPLFSVQPRCNPAGRFRICSCWTLLYCTRMTKFIERFTMVQVFKIRGWLTDIPDNTVMTQQCACKQLRIHKGDGGFNNTNGVDTFTTLMRPQSLEAHFLHCLRLATSPLGLGSPWTGLCEFDLNVVGYLFVLVRVTQYGYTYSSSSPTGSS